MIAASAVGAALRGVGEDAFVHGGGADFFGYGFGGIERRACEFITDEFDAKKEAETANVADVGMRLQRGEGGAEIFSGGLDASEKIAGFEVIEDGVAGSGGHGMSLVGKAVLESARAALEGFDDI